MSSDDGVATGADQAGADGVSAFGDYLRTQRQLAKLSLRQLAGLTRVSNPYLSQIERGLHQPSIAVVKSLAKALNVSADVLLAHAAGIEPGDDDLEAGGTEAAIREDSRLTASQKETLLAVYRSLVGVEPAPSDEPHEPAGSPTTPSRSVKKQAAPAKKSTPRSTAAPARKRKPSTS
jgi:transcriptional regulator with XRE-family HTH domain